MSGLFYFVRIDYKSELRKSSLVIEIKEDPSISMRIYYPFLFLAPVVFSTGCEKSVDIIPRNALSSPVVEAFIENGQAPVVVLSNSVNYFSKISPDILAASFVHDAEIRISNGNLTHRLREYKTPGRDGYDLFYYSIDSTSLLTAFTGVLGGKYNLSIRIAGKEYSAATTIPPLTKTIDSLWWEKAPSATDTGKVKLMARVTDPPAYGNYIRYFTSVNNRTFLPGLVSVFDDQIINGKTYSIQVDQGVDRNAELDRENFNFFRQGDTINVKFCNIDKATFDFWRTLEFSYSSIGNPFATPTKVIGNINGGALGYFGGYAVQYSSLIVPR